MTYALQLFTAPASEPLTRTEAKSHLRVDTTDDDALIDALIVAARQHVEAVTRRALITQTWDLVLDNWPGNSYLAGRDFIEIPLPPLQSVTSLKYTDNAGTITTFAASNYLVNTAAEPGRLTLAYGVYWPSLILSPSAPIALRFVAGYGTAANVPQAIKQAMLILIGGWYENRESVELSRVGFMPIPFTVDALLMPYRIFRF